MDFLPFVTAVSVRSLILAAVAAILAIRLKSPAARHALWSIVTAGMLAIAVATATLPTLPIRVLVARASRPASPGLLPVFHFSPSPAPPPRPFPWPSTLYLTGLLFFTARLAYAYHLTRKLVRTSTPTGLPAVYESPHINVPVTVGSKVFLPAGWQSWTPEKLDAVLVHERNHVQRADWAIAVLAGVNRCVFWFHPLAWWLESHLRMLAEQSCDDASLPHVASRECYAQVLVEMAAAVGESEGRVGWEAMAMARTAEVKMRVERILDDSRKIFPGMTRTRWATMALLAVPVIYLAAVARPARILAQDPPPRPTPVVEPQPAPPQTSSDELSAARAALARAEAEITKFKSDNMGRLPEQFQMNVAQLQSLQMRLNDANEALAHLQREKLLLTTQLQNLNNQVTYYQGLPPDQERLTDLERRIEDARVQLAKAAETYGPSHPAMKRLQDDLAALERQRREVKSGDPQTQKSLLDMEASIAMVRAQIQNANLSMDEKLKQLQEMNRTIAQYQQRIENSPQMEMQYAQMMRTYEEAQQRVQELSQRATGPELISRSEPDYTNAARKARIQGKVELSVTVGTDGVPRDIKVTRSLDPGLDAQAIESVKTWRFRPATRDGQPVTSFIVVEVPFRLL